MLDAKSLEVLQSLKSEIKANKTVLNGTIKGTGKSFGFVISDEGDEHFLPPDEMKKVFPGDRVTFTVVEQNDGKTRAELETLVESTLKEFNGVYYVRGKAQGVEPFADGYSGWLFVPHKQAGEAKHNDIVKAKVSRHPWNNGKAQAEILESLGSADNNRSWYSMTLAEQGLPETFSAEELSEAEQCTSNALPDTLTDLTAIPFVTIDSETTKDMDDALYAQQTDNGWTLKVAIADASLFIQPGTLLDQVASERLVTTYLPGLTLPMLPESLSNNAISLVENEVRPAMVFELSINSDGEVIAFDVQQAKIKSAGKLSYTAVADWLENDSIPDAHRANITALREATAQLKAWRNQRANTMQDRVDYRIRVNENFDVTTVEIERKNAARELVEEAMVATNAAVANWLNGNPGVFMAHKGFKPDRETELKGLLRDYAPTVADENGHELDGFLTITRQAATIEAFPLSKVLQKRFDRGYWSTQAEPHFGLGFPSYTNATSPIRKYSDLITHRQIKAKLNGDQLLETENVVQQLNERGNVSRQIANTIENRLRLKWLEQQEAQSWSATIVHLNANGLMAQLDDNGAIGFIDLKKKKDEYSYDPLRMMLKFEDHHYQLDQKLTVTIRKIDGDSLSLAIAN